MKRTPVDAMPAFTPIAHDTKQESAYQQIREALMSSRFMPGQKVSIRATAQAMGTSPMPVREAMWRLEAQKALVLLPERAFAVPRISKAELAEISDIRVALEGLATEQAASRLSESDLDDVVRIGGEMERALAEKDAVAYFDLNRAFHFAIYQGSRSSLLISMIESVWLRFGPSLNLVFDDTSHLRSSMILHAKAGEALLAGDGASAREAIAADVSGGMDDLMRRLPEGDDDAAETAGAFAP